MDPPQKRRKEIRKRREKRRKRTGFHWNVGARKCIENKRTKKTKHGELKKIGAEQQERLSAYGEKIC